MTSKTSTFILFLAATLALAGCARNIVKNPETSYDSMGMIEERVSVKSPVLTVLTLGFIREHSYKSLTRKLDRRLEHMALHKYGADAVNNIEYWPAPNSDATIDYLYARGEMIRFKKFGDTFETPQPAAG